MHWLNFKVQKRLPITVGVLVVGVAITSLVANFIEAPQASHDYLHDHLESAQATSEVKWAPSPFNIPAQDKKNISELIGRIENPSFKSGQDYTLTGQAFKAALKTACVVERETCVVPVRLNRRLTATQVNADLRVANIQERSLRVDFEKTHSGTETKLTGMLNETRNLRFYQTQAGWVQNTAEIVEENPLSYHARDEKFLHIFSNDFVGLNYYPGSAPWREFWTVFPVAEIKADLEKANQLNVNALRIFLTHDYFDETISHEEALEKLSTFLDLCETNDIQVLVTLFDLRPDYTMSNWTADINHIDKVLSSLSGHRAILAIDLKNQPDLDFVNWGEGIVQGWLTVMARHIQTRYPNLPVTAGWSKPENASLLKDVFDLVTYHEYQDPKSFESRLNTVKTAVGAKPVMITELGSTIWHPPFISSWTESAQAKRLNSQLDQADKANGIFVWTLNDFDYVGSEVVGRLPWRQAQQRHFGLYRSDGTARPAAAVLTTYGERKIEKNKQSFANSSLSQQ